MNKPLSIEKAIHVRSYLQRGTAVRHVGMLKFVRTPNLEFVYEKKVTIRKIGDTIQM